MIRLLVVLALFGLQLPLQWNICPVCNRGFSGMTPGAPCSSGCAARQRRDEALGQSRDPKHAGSGVGPSGGGQHRAPGTGGRHSKAKSGCLEIVLAPVGGAAVVAALVALLRRRS